MTNFKKSLKIRTLALLMSFSYAVPTTSVKAIPPKKSAAAKKDETANFSSEQIENAAFRLLLESKKMTKEDQIETFKIISKNPEMLKKIYKVMRKINRWHQISEDPNEISRFLLENIDKFRTFPNDTFIYLKYPKNNKYDPDKKKYMIPITDYLLSIRSMPERVKFMEHFSQHHAEKSGKLKNEMKELFTNQTHVQFELARSFESFLQNNMMTEHSLCEVFKVLGDEKMVIKFCDEIVKIMLKIQNLPREIQIFLSQMNNRTICGVSSQIIEVLNTIYFYDSFTPITSAKEMFCEILILLIDDHKIPKKQLLEIINLFLPQYLNEKFKECQSEMFSIISSDPGIPKGVQEEASDCLRLQKKSESAQILALQIFQRISGVEDSFMFEGVFKEFSFFDSSEEELNTMSRIFLECEGIIESKGELFQNLTFTEDTLRELLQIISQEQICEKNRDLIEYSSYRCGLSIYVLNEIFRIVVQDKGISEGALDAIYQYVNGKSF